MYEQTSIFDFAYPSFKLTKPVKLIELFSGYGSQSLALDYLGADYESFRICEWSLPSCIAYKAIHSKDQNDYGKGLTKEQIVRFLVSRGCSLDWNTPAKKDQLNRKPIEWLKLAYNSIIATHNLVDISKAKGADFAMRERERVQVVMTYSFPCQDLSLAGQMQGMDEGSGTRSSLLWQVSRILKEMSELNQLPDCLVMENVVQVDSHKNANNIGKWQDTLSKLGYKSYIKHLKATDFGIPQNRNRCFMVSVLGDYSYQFPTPKRLEAKLKDFLVEEADEKYYLTSNEIKYILAPQKTFNKCPKINREIAATIHSDTSIQRAQFDNYVQTSDKKKDDEVSYHYEFGEMQKSKNAQTIQALYSSSYSFKHGPVVGINVKRLRRLVPLECWRLMGVKDSDFDKANKLLNDNTLYHLAGDSIVVPVLMALFGQMLNIQKDWWFNGNAH